MKLNHEKGAPPLYFQIENILKEKIEKGEYAYGEVLPSEKQLQELYDVSRVTVRQAVSSLVNAGYLQSSQGIGTTVIFEEKIDEKLKRVISFSEEMEQHGIKMETSYCDITLEKADKWIASKLNIKEGDEAYKLVRVRSAKAAPIVYSITYLKKNYDLPLDPRQYMKSLYNLLESQYGVKIVKGQDTFEATLADKEIGRYLNISAGSPVFKRTRKTTNQENELVEYAVCYYPGDKYKYSVEL
ncbi:GntR family transcriptional regulator [Anaerocolumna sp. AGMB13025]|uniref:GntR family transcriptional regulator n=1 Tax=Anaerocolumna sp. AGMB13025 TaxID=3039116 RepID=UPI00241DEC6B|nr:GntR family transcriptional regulator [Anaerocolumna sp. AGMB13025]WFR57899.1 GntR family transcriptional regulator [Anaerocolumna sp. AGMB13025]